MLSPPGDTDGEQATNSLNLLGHPCAMPLQPSTPGAGEHILLPAGRWCPCPGTLGSAGSPLSLTDALWMSLIPAGCSCCVWDLDLPEVQHPLCCSCAQEGNRLQCPCLAQGLGSRCVPGPEHPQLRGGTKVGTVRPVRACLTVIKTGKDGGEEGRSGVLTASWEHPKCSFIWSQLHQSSWIGLERSWSLLGQVTARLECIWRGNRSQE